MSDVWRIVAASLIAAALYATAWYRGYAAYKNDVPHEARSLRQRMVNTDAASVAALKRAVQAEAEVERLRAWLWWVKESRAHDGGLQVAMGDALAGVRIVSPEPRG